MDRLELDRWKDCVAVVTGASSGIGKTTVVDLLNAELKVVGLARRDDRMEQHKLQMSEDQQKRYHTIKCDVSSEESVTEAFRWIEKELGGVDILINNAAILNQGQAVSMDVAKMQQVLQVNVMGIVYCTQHAFKSMKERKVAGHVVNVNSSWGHNIPMPQGLVAPLINMYGPSKYALRALTEIFRQEFRGLNTKIKITSVSPGLTDTEIVPGPFKTEKVPILTPENVSQCIMFALSTPPQVQVEELIVKPLLGE